MPEIFHVAILLICFNGNCTSFESVPFIKETSQEECQNMLRWTFETQAGPYYDERIDFIAGFHGLKAIEKKVDSGQAKIGFSLFATQIENVISFADKKLTMPPKSTWFDPKPLDGLVTYDFE